jgi:hypothetical protein
MSKTKTLNQLIKMVCEIEAGKKQLNAGDCRQALSVIKKLILNDVEFLKAFIKYISNEK